jgi:uncharacterized membrane protein YhaH (DUF805 family)
MVSQRQGFARHARWTLLLTSVLAAVQIVAVFQALRPPANRVSSSIPAGAQAVVSSLWALAFLAGAAALIAHRPHALKRVLWLMCGFLFYSVLRLVVFTRADYDRQRLPLLLAVSILVLIALASAYFSQRKRLRNDDAQQNDGESFL